MEYLGQIVYQVYRNEGLANKTLTFASLLFTGLFIIDRGLVTWVLSTIFTLLGIVNFILQIRKNAKKEK